MKYFVTGVAGQLGHDVMNELAKRGMEGVGSDLAENYSGMQDGTPVCGMPYLPMDITNPENVRSTILAFRKMCGARSWRQDAMP